MIFAVCFAGGKIIYNMQWSKTCKLDMSAEKTSGVFIFFIFFTVIFDKGK